MRNVPNVKAERWRVRVPGSPYDAVDGNCGAFRFAHRGVVLTCIVSDVGGWDHVSVSTPTRCPTWEEMCAVKDLFFRDDEVVMQLHPAKSNYVNNHPFVLHLWRPQTLAERMAIEPEHGANPIVAEAPTPGPIPLPPIVMV